MLFGMLFYRRNSTDNDGEVEMREFNIFRRRKLAEAHVDFAR